MTAQQQFVEELMPHYQALHRMAHRLGDPDELLQETMLHALSARAQYRPGSNPRAWLYRIMVNVAMTQHRKHTRTRRLEARLSEVHPQAFNQENERRRAIACALERLGPRERRIVELSDVEGRSYREIAGILDCPLGTVMSRLCRARRKLRACLDA